MKLYKCRLPVSPLFRQHNILYTNQTSLLLFIALFSFHDDENSNKIVGDMAACCDESIWKGFYFGEKGEGIVDGSEQRLLMFILTQWVSCSHAQCLVL